METGDYPMVSYLLQQTLHRLCTDSDWVYAVFWRILPRNYPPPKWESESSVVDRSKGNKRNWILVWEDGYCDFVACAKSGDHELENANHEAGFMQPELFFKMSHEIYNYGEGLVGKVAADNSHKWIYKEPTELNQSQFGTSWQGAIDPHPRTWEAQFKSGIETIAIVGVKEGVLQLGSLKKASEDLNLVLSLQRKFNYLQSIPGVYAVHPVQLMQHDPSSSRKLFPLPSAAAFADSWPSDLSHPPPHWPPDVHPLRPPPANQLSPATQLAMSTPLFHLVQPALPPHPCQPNYHQLDGMQASLQALLLRLPAVTIPPPSTASSSSTSPTGHPYNVFTNQVG